MLQCVAVCCSVLQCVAVFGSMLQCVAVRWSVLHCRPRAMHSRICHITRVYGWPEAVVFRIMRRYEIAVCCRVLQYVAVCCSVLQCVALSYMSHNSCVWVAWLCRICVYACMYVRIRIYDVTHKYAHVCVCVYSTLFYLRCDSFLTFSYLWCGGIRMCAITFSNIHIHTCIHTHRYMHTYECAYMWLFRVCDVTYSYVWHHCMCVCMCVFEQLMTWLYVCVCIHVYVSNTQVLDTYTCIHTHVYIHWRLQLFVCIQYICIVYSPFRGRRDSKWWSECKAKSSSESRNYRFMALFKFSCEKRPRAIVSWFRWGFRFAFRSPFGVSSSTERAVHTLYVYMCMCVFEQLKTSLYVYMCMYTCVCIQYLCIRYIHKYTCIHKVTSSIVRMHTYTHTYMCMYTCVFEQLKYVHIQWCHTYE